MRNDPPDKHFLCVPVLAAGASAGLDTVVSAHFGRTPSFVLVETETGEVEVLANTSFHFGGHLSPADLVAKAGVAVVLCRSIGTPARNRLRDLGVDVVTVSGRTVRDVVLEYEVSTVAPGKDAPLRLPWRRAPEGGGAS